MNKFINGQFIQKNQWMLFSQNSTSEKPVGAFNSEISVFRIWPRCETGVKTKNNGQQLQMFFISHLQLVQILGRKSV